MMKDFFYTLPFKSNLLKTIYFNFKVFPFRVARKLPVRIIGRVRLLGLRRGCVNFLNKEHVSMFSVTIGSSAFDWDSYTTIKFAKNSLLELGESVIIHKGANISINADACISIGDDVFFNHNAFIACSNKITIGSHVSVGWNCQIVDSDFHSMYDMDMDQILSPLGSVEIGNYVWIGNHTFISKNAIIPSDSILSSNSLLNKDFSMVKTRGNLFVGMPAKLKRTGLHRIFNLDIDRMLQKSIIRGETRIDRSSLPPSELFMFEEYFKQVEESGMYSN